MALVLRELAPLLEDYLIGAAINGATDEQIGRLRAILDRAASEG